MQVKKTNINNIAKVMGENGVLKRTDMRLRMKKRTYFEDDVCDDPDDSLRYPNVCQPWLFDDDEDDYLNIFNSFYFGIIQV